MNIKEILKGVIIGIAKIIPGLSGAVVMISFNLYDRAIFALTNFFDNPKKNFWFLFNLAIGIGIGIVMFSNVIAYFIRNYYVYTTSLFVGLILGGIPVIFKDVGNRKESYVIVVMSFLIMTLLSFSGINNNYIVRGNYVDIVVYFVAGLLEAFGTILPGISSTALLMLMGVYDIFLGVIGNLFFITDIKENLVFMIPFSLGLLIGIIGISLLVNFLFRYYREKTFAFILGVSLSSVFLLFFRVVVNIGEIGSFVICLIFCCLGYVLTKKII